MLVAVSFVLVLGVITVSFCTRALAPVVVVVAAVFALVAAMMLAVITVVPPMRM